MERRHLKAKICLVGEAAVGKSSLIRRYVENLYSDSYLMTIGAKVSKKRLYVPFEGDPLPVLLELAVWDIMGQPKFRELLQEAYFTGVTGIIGVTDLSRPDTLTALYEWIDRVDRVTSQAALVFAVVAQMGPVYLAAAVILGAGFLWRAFRLWREGSAPEASTAQAIRLYRYSITYLTLLFVAVAIDPLIRF